MTYLLDTHVWLWMLMDPQRIRDDLLGELRDPRARAVLSTVSSWEIAIKWSVGKLAMPDPPEVLIPDWIERSGVEALAISHAHALRVASLPMHHGDPFDRLLVAQAQVERISIVTADPAFDRYDVQVVHATAPA